VLLCRRQAGQAQRQAAKRRRAAERQHERVRDALFHARASHEQERTDEAQEITRKRGPSKVEKGFRRAAKFDHVLILCIFCNFM
jgi:hypothetical protein